jgi:hypothetical protein
VTVAITAIVALRSNLLDVATPFEFVATSGMVLAALLVLPIDLFADKFPGSGGLMDRAGWVIRPLAGAMLGGAVIAEGGPAILGGMALGLLGAALTHGLRLYVRGRVQWRLLGFGRIVFGAYGDFGSGIVALVAILSPPLGAAIAVMVLAAALAVDRRWGGPEPEMSVPTDTD